MKQNNFTQQQIDFAQAAANGNPEARNQVNQLIHPVIDYHSNLFCKRFCDQHRHQFRCTLSSPWGSMSINNPLCEWGNASYGWMLDDLTHSKRLQNYQARNDATLFDYLYHIANSLPFYERWKDWRFGRKVHVPAYIENIAPQAKTVFYSLQSGHDSELIAQKLSLTKTQCETIIRKIVTELSKRHRLHLLDPPKTQSLSISGNSDDEDSGQQMDIAVTDDEFLVQDEKTHVNKAWQTLNAAEQFVIEALVIDDLDARKVLDALAELGISIKKGVKPEDSNVQQLYYFKRKALARLSEQLEQ